LENNSYSHFVDNDEPNVGHLDGLLATEDSLYVADFSPRGSFGAAQSNTGVIYQIQHQRPTVLQPGDADMDLDFDQNDLVRVQIAAKYRTELPATWGDGDWNGAPGGSPGAPPAGDGRFDQRDIIRALASGVYLSGPYRSIVPGGVADDRQVSVEYDSATGELFIDGPTALELTSINVDSAAGIFTGNPAQHMVYVPEPASITMGLLAILACWIMPLRGGQWTNRRCIHSLKSTF